MSRKRPDRKKPQFVAGKDRKLFQRITRAVVHGQVTVAGQTFESPILRLCEGEITPLWFRWVESSRVQVAFRRRGRLMLLTEAK